MPNQFYYKKVNGHYRVYDNSRSVGTDHMCIADSAEEWWAKVLIHEMNQGLPYRPDISYPDYIELKTRREGSTMKAWTYIYTPFIMGGNVHRPTGFEFQDQERVELGKGYYGYVLTSPHGRCVVVEERSGAITGSLLETVRSEIAESDEKVMSRQVDEACRQSVRIISAEAFWKLYEKHNPVESEQDNKKENEAAWEIQ